MNARILSSTRPIWSRHACAASRAETSRLEIFEISSEIVSSLSIKSCLVQLIAAQKVAKKPLKIKVIRNYSIRICFEFPDLRSAFDEGGRSSNFGFRIPIVPIQPYPLPMRITGGKQARRILKVPK